MTRVFIDPSCEMPGSASASSLEGYGQVLCNQHDLAAIIEAHVSSDLVLNNGRRLSLLQGDITRIAADAIANAANSALAGGGGVDGAIHRAGGPAIMAELDSLRPNVGALAAGQAVATTAGRLPARFVFHACGPIWRGGSSGEPEALASCYRVCLSMAGERELRSISFPSISTGIYGFPLEQAAPIAIGEILAYLVASPGTVETVSMVLFDERTYRAYERAMPSD